MNLLDLREFNKALNDIYTSEGSSPHVGLGDILSNISSAVSSGLQLTTKGDLAGFSTVPDRIPVGANGFVLTADSSVPLGVKWAAGAGTGITWSTPVDANVVADSNNIRSLGSSTINFFSVWTNLVLSLGTVVRTGDTHTSSTIDNLSSVTDLTTGMSVNGSGIPHNTTIGSFPTANSIALINSATGLPVSTTSSLVGTTITFVNGMSARSQNNTTAASAIDTGQGSFRSGDITGAGSSGNTGDAFFRAGDITSASATGATGLVASRSGNNAGSGPSGSYTARSGNTISGASGSAALRSGTSTTGPTGGVFLQSGNSSSGGTTGDVLIGPGTTSGTRGKIRLVDATVPNIGDVWTATASNGAGTWQGPKGGTGQFGAAQTTINVVDARVTTASLITVTLTTNDATAWVKNIVPLAGSFDVNLGDPATGTTDFKYIILGEFP